MWNAKRNCRTLKTDLKNKCPMLSGEIRPKWSYLDITKQNNDFKCNQVNHGAQGVTICQKSQMFNSNKDTITNTTTASSGWTELQLVSLVFQKWQLYKWECRECCVAAWRMFGGIPGKGPSMPESIIWTELEWEARESEWAAMEAGKMERRNKEGERGAVRHVDINNLVYQRNRRKQIKQETSC